jgi:polygalacturonase
LYVFANPIQQSTPDCNDPKVKYFKSGQVYEVGQLNLTSNETLYIEGGAVVRGSIFASSSENIRISGFGVLDGSYYVNDKNQRSILFADCKNSIIENIIMIEPTSWMIVLGLCENVTVQNTKQLGFVSTSDGVDIVGSKHIRVLNSFIRSGDDCVVVKAFDMSRFDDRLTKSFSADVEDVEANGCIVIAHKGGQAFEIGHELTTNSIKNIRFKNCDVLGVHDQGGVFGIHNTDRALISNILYEDIRVEHFYNKLVDFRIIKSRYFKDEDRGRIQNVLFKNIDITVTQYNPGYSISIIGGYNSDHKVENVVFDNFMMNGEKVVNANQLDLFTKEVSGIVFK